MAAILESTEIKRLWPVFNTSQKRQEEVYGFFVYEDQNGYCRLVIEKKKNNLKSYYTFNTMNEGVRLLNQLTHQFDLAVNAGESTLAYNNRVYEAVDHLEKMLPTFAVMDERSDVADGRSCILIEKGRFYGMGYLPGDATVYSYDELKTYLQAYPENDYIRGLVYQYVQKRPEKKLVF